MTTRVHLIEPLHPKASRERRREQASAALALIDMNATGPGIEYCFSMPFSRADVAEALQVGRCRTVRNKRRGNNSTAHRRGVVGDMTIDMQGLVAEIVLLSMLREAHGVEQVAPMLELAPSKAPDLVAGGVRYDLKAVGLRKAADVVATGCNVNEVKEPDVLVVCRIDYDEFLLHVYAVDAPSIRTSDLWAYKTGYSPYYERQMPDAAQYRRRTAPVWLIEMMGVVLTAAEQQEALLA